MPTKKTELPVEEGMELGSQMSDTPIPQTETEIRQDVGSLPEETPVLPDESPNSQTDSESGPESENSEEDGAEESNLTLSPQTDSESEENALEKGPKARRTRRASTKNLSLVQRMKLQQFRRMTASSRLLPPAADVLLSDRYSPWWQLMNAWA